MFRKKLPILTATSCVEMESVRLAIEVLTGQYVRFQNLDFNTGRGMVRMGKEEKIISFFFGRSDLLHFSFWNKSCEPGEWYTAVFRTDQEVRVIKDSDNPHKRGPHDMWWVGRSATDRWEEPLYPKAVEYSAQYRGLTLEEYLAGCESYK